MTSTESPPDHVIPFHHEMVYITRFPKRLFFWCELPAKDGEVPLCPQGFPLHRLSLLAGETPVCLSYRICHRLEEELPEFYQKIKEKKIRYLRTIADKHSSDFSSAYQKGKERNN